MKTLALAILLLVSLPVFGQRKLTLTVTRGETTYVDCSTFDILEVYVRPETVFVGGGFDPAFMATLNRIQQVVDSVAQTHIPAMYRADEHHWKALDSILVVLRRVFR